ncbi:MAG: hypothetical protein ACRCZF_21255 [Gemmataceae bacterium]
MTRILFLGLVALSLFLTGCSAKPTYGTVAGQITLQGKPQGKIRVEFHPDAVAGTVGLSAIGETDDEGRFTLTTMEGGLEIPGAVVGKHRVVLLDLALAESETGRGIAQRLNPNFGSIGTTTVQLEVKPGASTMKIEISELR